MSILIQKENLPTGLFINNRFVPSVSGRAFESINPANGNVITKVAEATAEDVDLAVDAAHEAFQSWKHVEPQLRAKLLNRLADLVERDSDMFAHLESLDNGKPLTESLTGDIPSVIWTLRYYAGWADKFTGKVVTTTNDLHCYTRLEPWNYPLLMLAWKLAPAIATGNTIVLKSSEKTPLSALKLGELIIEAGFPAGVINILSGFGPTAGAAIAKHSKIKKVAFTGSLAVGRKIMEMAAQSNLKKVSLELGGKSPNIIFEDADLDEAVKWAANGIFYNQGQVCCAGSRVFVQESIHDAFITKLKEHILNMKIGNPLDPQTQLGPLVDSIQHCRVLEYIKIAETEGAKLVIGGKRWGNEGYFIHPTVYINVNDDMTIAKEEIFGPVLCVLKFKTYEEVIQRANASEYGLAAAVHTKNGSLQIRAARDLEAGTIWVNCYNVDRIEMPFGGFKSSGIGRELGESSISEYTQVKSIIQNIAQN